MRFYTYDPGCPKFTSWDGFKCQANYTEYCKSLTPLFIKQTGDNQTTVAFNGTACVVVVNPEDSKAKGGGNGTVPVGGKDGETGPKTLIPVIEMSQKRTREAELRKAGTDQIAHTVALVFIIIGVFIYIVVDFREKKEEQVEKDPKEMMVKQNDEALMVPKIEYENMETEVGMSDARLNESTDKKDKDPDEVDGDALTNNTPRGASSRRDSVNSDYQGYNALKHHLHFEALSPNKKKRRFGNAAGALGLNFGNKKKNKNKIEFDLTPELMGQTEEDLEKTRANLILKEQIEKQHGTIIQDDSTRIKEGAASVDDAELQISDRAKKPIDFHSNYKYLPKDGTQRIAAAAARNPQGSIEEKDDEDEEVQTISRGKRQEK